MSKAEVLSEITRSGIIPVIRGVRPDRVEELADHLVEGGVSALEITLDSPNAFALIGKLNARLQGKALVGAGTVLDREGAFQAIQSGAEFLISPALSREVIETASRYGKVAIPGVMTPTEMVQAVQWGADFVKVFPARQLGAKYIKDVKAPLSHISIIPTGGVNLDNIAEFIQAGASAVGIGSNLIDKTLIENKAFDEIQAKARQYVEAVRQAREK